MDKKQINVLKKVFSLIDTYQDKAIELQKNLTSISALGPENNGDGEKEKAEYLIKELQKTGMDEVTTIKAPDKRVACGYRPNIISRLFGDPQKPFTWLLTHMDIVPPGDMTLWDTDPFQLHIKGDKIVGRGVEDNQQSMVSSILACRAIIEARIKPEGNAGLAIVADEETGSAYGLDFLIKNHPDLFSKKDYIIVPDFGNKDGTLIEIAEKSILWLKFTIKGKQVHASTPDKGINTTRAMSQLIVRLDRLTAINNKTDPLFDPPGSTFEPTMIKTNVSNINTIPGKDIFCLDCRILPEYDLKDIKETIKIICKGVEEEYGVRITVEDEQYAQAAPATPLSAGVVKVLSEAIQFVTGKKPCVKGIGGGTVAAFFRKADLDAAVWFTASENAHQANEFCLLSNIISDAKVFAYIILNGQ